MIQENWSWVDKCKDFAKLLNEDNIGINRLNICVCVQSHAMGLSFFVTSSKSPQPPSLPCQPCPFLVWHQYQIIAAASQQSLTLPFFLMLTHCDSLNVFFCVALHPIGPEPALVTRTSTAGVAPIHFPPHSHLLPLSGWLLTYIHALPFLAGYTFSLSVLPIFSLIGFILKCPISAHQIFDSQPMPPSTLLVPPYCSLKSLTTLLVYDIVTPLPLLYPQLVTQSSFTLILPLISDSLLGTVHTGEDDWLRKALASAYTLCLSPEYSALNFG